jgi:hypothetical protein
VYIGDSTSADPSLNIIVAGNTISNVHSVNRGAYAIHTNNGSSTAPSAIGYTTVAIWGNTISDLLGGVWAHAIGLEGDTPGVIVRLNSISNVNAGTPNRVAVYFEDNPSFASGHVNQNNLDVTPAAYGIAVNPVPATSVALVDGTCNWWGDKGGPGPIGPNPLGAKVGPNVDFDPWLTSRAPSRCGPAKPPKCQPGTAVNGSGDVSGTDERGKHQGHFDFDECDGDHEFSHRDSDRNVDFHSDTGAPGTTTVDAASPTATTTGQGWNNGAPVSYQLVVTDLGIGPGTDVYSLTLSDPSGVIYSITGTLTAGNLNVHP